jgi:hypothetical protein
VETVAAMLANGWSVSDRTVRIGQPGAQQ